MCCRGQPRFLGLALPRDRGPALGVAGRVAVRSGDDLGMSLLFFGMFVALLYIATSAPRAVIGLGLFAGGAFWPTTFRGTCRTGFVHLAAPRQFYNTVYPNSYQPCRALR